MICVSVGAFLYYQKLRTYRDSRGATPSLKRQRRFIPEPAEDELHNYEAVVPVAVRAVTQTSDDSAAHFHEERHLSKRPLYKDQVHSVDEAPIAAVGILTTSRSEDVPVVTAIVADSAFTDQGQDQKPKYRPDP